MSPLLLLLLGLLSLVLCVLRGRSRRDGEPPLIKGWIPFIGKALEFGRDAHKFLEEHKKKFGDIFTVQIAGKYMTFIMDPLMYPSIIKHGRQLDFNEFSNTVAPFTFGYPPVISRKFPGMREKIKRSFHLLQGDSLTPLTESMMSNLMLLFRQDHLEERPGDDGGWRSGSMYEFCYTVMFEATFLTMYGRPLSAIRHSRMGVLREDFIKFDIMFPLLIAQIPLWLLGQTKAIREKLINYFLPHRMSCWSNMSQFIKRRSEVFNQYDSLTDSHKAESAISESLRLSSASMNIRVAQENFDLRLDSERSVAVRKGDIIALYPQSMHLDPDIYEEPQTFQFDRYMQDGRERTDFYKNNQKLKHYLMPFGSGSSMCPGRFFAINEIKQFLCLLLLYFDVQVEDGQTRATLDSNRAGLGILQPTTDVRFRYRLRTV
ncbi:cholesterol 7-alpha-monooxygenase-like isoform X2 [Seriola lalandi dorsalis]|uniref:cholesterol 7-alpha-monooxygenase-like isoform X2 n=1 Tax=Seriola lalandi dorsalis TaxID=1841481 RepID=UPI000C6F560E|nr:cholesterol 7-alpha-monooxygenase-like isoform X2 [Seriola lalandi dorsalis]